MVANARAMPEREYSPALRQAVERARPILRIRDLRPGQAEVIESVLRGRDTLAIMPTGSGKSLTYQIACAVVAWTHAGGLAAAGAH